MLGFKSHLGQRQISNLLQQHAKIYVLCISSEILSLEHSINLINHLQLYLYKQITFAVPCHYKVFLAVCSKLKNAPPGLLVRPRYCI